MDRVCADAQVVLRQRTGLSLIIILLVDEIPNNAPHLLATLVHISIRISNYLCI